jgi:hypothetical protein
MSSDHEMYRHRKLAKEPASPAGEQKDIDLSVVKNEYNEVKEENASDGIKTEPGAEDLTGTRLSPDNSPKSSSMAIKKEHTPELASSSPSATEKASKNVSFSSTESSSVPQAVRRRERERRNNETASTIERINNMDIDDFRRMTPGWKELLWLMVLVIVLLGVLQLFMYYRSYLGIEPARAVEGMAKRVRRRKGKTAGWG